MPLMQQSSRRSSRTRSLSFTSAAASPSAAASTANRSAIRVSVQFPANRSPPWQPYNGRLPLHYLCSSSAPHLSSSPRHSGLTHWPPVLAKGLHLCVLVLHTAFDYIYFFKLKHLLPFFGIWWAQRSETFSSNCLFHANSATNPSTSVLVSASALLSQPTVVLHGDADLGERVIGTLAAEMATRGVWTSVFFPYRETSPRSTEAGELVQQ